MPEHTGTATIHGFLSTHKEQMSIDFTNCAHTHYHLSPPGANFTFAMVANPFRRVLSNAFHRFQWNWSPGFNLGNQTKRLLHSGDLSWPTKGEVGCVRSTTT